METPASFTVRPSKTAGIIEYSDGDGLMEFSIDFNKMDNAIVINPGVQIGAVIVYSGDKDWNDRCRLALARVASFFEEKGRNVVLYKSE